MQVVFASAASVHAAAVRATQSSELLRSDQRRVDVCKGLLMALGSSVCRYGMRFHRRGVLSRSSFSASASSCNNDENGSHRRDGSDRRLATRHLRWNNYYGNYGPPPPPRPPSYCMTIGVPTKRFVNTRGSGGASDIDSKEQSRQTPAGNIPSNPGGGGGGSSSVDDDNFLLKALGPRWSPYGRLARIDKPAGTLLLLFPCWWGIALAAPMHTLPDLKLMALFATGAVVMRYVFTIGKMA